MKKKILVITIILFISSAVHAEKSGLAMYICQDISDKTEKELCIDRATTTIRDKTNIITGSGSKGISLGFFSIFWPWAWWGLYYGLGFLIGLYIFKDSKSREWVFLGIRPIYWLILAVFDPAIGIIAYWLLHYSRFSMSYAEAITSVKDPSDKR